MDLDSGSPLAAELTDWFWQFGVQRRAPYALGPSEWLRSLYDARSSLRTFRAARVSKAGAFTLTPVLPGEYFIVAVPDEGMADFPDQKLLAALARWRRRFASLRARSRL